MALDTEISLRNQVMYCVFVRNYSEEGTFEAVRKDLDRIRSLGTDMIWFMPIQPTGQVHRKGSLGSPYAIRDYRAVNPEFGTMDDFKKLVKDIHEKGMKCIMDVVYNHTSPDSVLAKTHPEWFYHKPDGSLGNRVGDWWDVVDLNYDAGEEMWQYQIDTLKMWAEIVDGFRCDVAPMVPLAFWERARREVAEVRPGCLWLAESVEPPFVAFNRSRNVRTSSDSELYRAFDMTYEYDLKDEFTGYFMGTKSLADYSHAINLQECIYPENYVKLRFLENHDMERAHDLIRDDKALRNWTAFAFFQKGIALIYNGQEAECTHRPTLFDKDTIDWSYLRESSIPALMTKLSEIKKNPVFKDSFYETTALPNDVMMAVHRPVNRSAAGAMEGEETGGPKMALGFFCLGGKNSLVQVGQLGLEDGAYTNVIDGKELIVHQGRLPLDGEPVVLLV